MILLVTALAVAQFQTVSGGGPRDIPKLVTSHKTATRRTCVYRYQGREWEIVISPLKRCPKTSAAPAA